MTTDPHTTKIIYLRDHLFQRASRIDVNHISIDGLELRVQDDTDRIVPELLFFDGDNCVGYIYFDHHLIDENYRNVCGAVLRPRCIIINGKHVALPHFTFYLKDGEYLITKEPNYGGNSMHHGPVIKKHPFDVMIENYRAHMAS